jgi:hypothetical protein
VPSALASSSTEPAVRVLGPENWTELRNTGTPSNTETLQIPPGMIRGILFDAESKSATLTQIIQMIQKSMIYGCPRILKHHEKYIFDPPPDSTSDVILVIVLNSVGLFLLLLTLSA